MRVITGSARGRRLEAPPGLSTRPTSELVKEAIFSMVQFEIEGAAVLDLFAGSGQMGVEALSRGARSCVFVDTSKLCRDIIEKNIAATGFGDKAKIVGSDASVYIGSNPGSFDIAFLDPPYGKGVWGKLLDTLSGVMSSSGVIVCETDRSEDLPVSAGTIQKYREYRYGKTKITVYRRETENLN